MKITRAAIFLFLITAGFQINATKLVSVKIIDKEYLMAFFIDGQVNFVDDGLGSCAFQTCNEAANNSVQRFGTALNTGEAVNTANWLIRSDADNNYSGGINPVACYRKSKLNGMAQLDWSTTSNDFVYDYTQEHSIYLKLPFPLIPDKTYTLEISNLTNSDQSSSSFVFDIFNSRSEAIHVNLVGYMDDKSIKAVDLYHWMGNGGSRNYAGIAGNKVYIFNTVTKESTEVGTVSLWKYSATEAGNYNLTGSPVWKADFTGFSTPGNYRIAIDGVGCSEDFDIRKEIYKEPFRTSTRGFYYMRIGEATVNITPIPRRPLYIPGVSPSNTKVYVTTMHPLHPEWGTFSSGDVWDQPNDWARFVKPGSPQNSRVYGGHSDALDWDRHLGHISIIYDMLLPFILTDGRISDDDTGIAEMKNQIPDILDEARNEVDFWLRLRDGMGYSHGVTNPNSNNVLYQAENTPLAAWANAANSAMLSDCFGIAGITNLKEIYRDSAIAAYNYASTLPDQMLDKSQDVGEARLRGRDLKMMAAAYLYNVTGDTRYEDMMKSLSGATSNNSIIADGNMNQLWATAGYLKTRQPIRYPDLFSRMKSSLIFEAKAREADYTNTRPTRRATDNNTGYFKTIQNVQRTIVAHAISENQADKDYFLNALVLEADWGLGRNSANMIYMTTATSGLSKKRSVENAYTSGRDDGVPGMHPGHTPYINTDDWAPSMIMGRPSWMTSKCYPDYSTWPKAEGYFNTRYVWSHSEFTPQQTMRGKMALYAYLYGINKTISTSVLPEIPDSGPALFKIFPNPASGTFRILLAEGISEAEMIISDASGLQIMRKRISSGISDIPAGHYIPGVYLVSVSSGKARMTSKLIIQKS
jgi:endoglucanase